MLVLHVRVNIPRLYMASYSRLDCYLFPTSSGVICFTFLVQLQWHFPLPWWHAVICSILCLALYLQHLANPFWGPDFDEVVLILKVGENSIRMKLSRIGILTFLFIKVLPNLGAWDTRTISYFLNTVLVENNFFVFCFLFLDYILLRMNKVLLCPCCKCNSINDWN